MKEHNIANYLKLKKKDRLLLRLVFSAFFWILKTFQIVLIG